MDKNFPPRIAAIHDLSCFGRCALTVIIPTLSCMGCQVIPLPTALLSTHTGGFTDIRIRDLTEDMTAISGHYGKLGLTFDGIYSGFLGSEEQIGVVCDFILKNRNEHSCVLVDPVMGDDGSLYSTYTESLAKGMTKLASFADIITPNLTEACIMTGMTYPDKPFPDKASACAFASKICDELRGVTGVRKIVVTGITYEDRVCCACLDGDWECSVVENKLYERSFPGTGDIFASVLMGNIIKGRNLFDSVSNASLFTCRTIEYSQSSPYPTRDGVLLEPLLCELTDNKEIKK